MRSSIIPLLLIVPLLTAPLQAQAPEHHDPADLRAITRVGSYANGNVDLSPVQPGEQIVLQARSVVQDPAPPTSSSALASVFVSPLTSTRDNGARLDWLARVEAGSRAGTTRDGFPLTRRQLYSLRLESPTGRGQLKISFDVDGEGDAVVRASFADPNFSQRFSRTEGSRDLVVADFQVGAGRDFQISLMGEAVGRQGRAAGYQASLEITFTPSPALRCTILRGSSSCATGGVLQGRADGNVLALELRGGLPNGFGAAIASASGSMVSLLGSNCSILVATPVVVAVFPTDAAGNASHRLQLPDRSFTAWVQHVTLSLQGMPAGGVQIATSNSLGIACAKVR